MKSFLIGTLLAIVPMAAIATTLDLARITYPIYLPYNAEDAEIEIRKLPFATRFSHPEFIGAALSAAYVIPHNDGADLPKDINLVSACKIAIKTELFPEKREDKDRPVGIHLSVDLSKFTNPDYLPFEDREIIRSVANAIRRTLASTRCEIRSVKVVAGEGQKRLQKLIEGRLRKPIHPPVLEPDAPE